MIYSESHNSVTQVKNHLIPGQNNAPQHRETISDEAVDSSNGREPSLPTSIKAMQATHYPAPRNLSCTGRFTCTRQESGVMNDHVRDPASANSLSPIFTRLNCQVTVNEQLTSED